MLLWADLNGNSWHNSLRYSDGLSEKTNGDQIVWSKLTSRVSEENVDTLLGRADVFISSSDNKESLNWEGKDFFHSNLTEDNNQDLLRLFHLDIWPEISDIVDFNVPVIDHASLLVKGVGAAGTTLHQDRPYWVSREASPTIFSVWIALEDMSKE